MDSLLYHYTDLPYRRIGTDGSFSRYHNYLPQVEAADEIAKNLGFSVVHENYMPFFYAPLPFSELAEAFHKQHPLWSPKRKLYEYQFTLEKLGKSFFFVADPPDLIKPPIEQRGYWQAFLQKAGYCGIADVSLTDTVAKLRDAYPYSRLIRDLPKHPQYSRFRDDYLAGLPGIMLLPIEGSVTPSQVEQVVV